MAPVKGLRGVSLGEEREGSRGVLLITERDLVFHKDEDGEVEAGGALVPVIEG